MEIWIFKISLTINLNKKQLRLRISVLPPSTGWSQPFPSGICSRRSRGSWSSHRGDRGPDFFTFLSPNFAYGYITYQDVFLKGTGIVDNEGLVGRQAGKVSAQIVAARSELKQFNER